MLAVVLWLVTCLLGFGALVASVFLLITAFTRIRRKGYGPLATGLAMVGGWLVGLGAFMLGVFAIATESGVLALAMSFVLVVAGPVVPPALAFAAARWLPRKSNRIFGQRAPFPFKAIGRAINLGLGIPLAVLLFYVTWSTATTVKDRVFSVLATICGPAGLWLIGGGLIRRGNAQAAQPTLETALANDGRRPVVYVRPFEKDRATFVIGDKEKYGRYHTSLIDSSRVTIVAITFDEYLGHAIRKAIGPLVALGSPEDYLPPLGAARKYAEDATWQEDFDRLLTMAEAIVLRVGDSQNLQWELGQIKAHGLEERLFLVTGHSSLREGVPGHWLRRLSERWSGVLPFSWDEFSSILRGLGYQLDQDNPGPGAVVTFDAGGISKVLVTNADLPEDFVRPMVNHLATLQPGAVQSHASASA